MASQPPTIFSPTRRASVRARAASRQNHGAAADWLIAEAAEDVADRLAFLRQAPTRALVMGDISGKLAQALTAQGAEVTDGAAWDDELPFPDAGFDFAASLFRLDTANDLPGALIHLRAALTPGGLMIATLLGAGSLPLLRSLMLASDGERPAPRIHPQVDVRAAGQLMVRAGFADPVIDTCTITRSYASVGALVRDLRDQGLTSQLEVRSPRVTRAGLKRLQEGGPVTERFEILTLTGRRHQPPRSAA